MRTAEPSLSFHPSLALLLLTAAFAPPAIAAPGDGDPAFFANVDGGVYSSAVQADGKIVIGGAFNYVDATERRRLARLNADGGLDTGFNPNASDLDFVWATAVQADGKIVIGGEFTTVGGTARNNIARLNANGTLDAAFNPNANGRVYGMALRNDGKVVIGGEFTTVGHRGVSPSYCKIVGALLSECVWQGGQIASAGSRRNLPSVFAGDLAASPTSDSNRSSSELRLLMFAADAAVKPCWHM